VEKGISNKKKKKYTILSGGRDLTKKHSPRREGSKEFRGLPLVKGRVKVQGRHDRRGKRPTGSAGKGLFLKKKRSGTGGRGRRT